MTKYIVRRLILIIPILIGISIILFTIMNLTPGDPAQMLIGDTYTEEALVQLRHELGLDQPFFVRYFNYMKNALTGDFGISYRTRNPVFDEVFARFPHTVAIAMLSIVIQVVVGIIVGIVAAVKQYSLLDTVSQAITMILASVPDFWIGLMLLLFFSVKLKLLPLSGIESWKGYILPAVAVALPYMANLIRLTRSTMLDVMRMDYIQTAQSKGVPKKSVIFKHALKNALLPVVTIAGVNMSWMLGGTIVIEQVFNIPGIGSLMITSMRNKDTPVVMATVMFIALLSCLINLATDLIYAAIDPRVKAQIKG
ncbi:MAG: ABC transporter permease [Lachnospiraceae bacterium]|nr:ABC transporter permease [Lachnospiraceae bacterium]MBR6849475.1 ABC transporter permease [Lachnospiraceae bacterium]